MKHKLFNMAGFAIGPIMGGIIMLVVTSLTTHYLTPVEYGKSSMFTVIQGLIASFAYMGYDQAFTREFNENKNKVNLFMNSIFVPIILGIVFSISILIFHNIAAKILFTNSASFMLVIMFVLLIIFTIIERFIIMYIRMSEYGTQYTLFTMLTKILVLVFTLVGIKLGIKTFELVILPIMVGQIIIDILLIIKYRYLFSLSVREWLDISLIKKMFFFGFPILIATSLNNVLQFSDRFFIKLFSSYSELGIYSAGLKLASLMAIIQTIFINIWIPISYRWHKNNKPIRQFQLVSELANIILGNIVLITTFIGPIIQIFLSDSYRDVIFYFPLMIVPMYISCISETTNLGIVFSRKTYLNIVISFIILLINVLLSVVLVKMFGSRGAAFSNIISYVAFFILRTYFSVKNNFSINITHQMRFITLVILICVYKAIFNVSDIISFVVYTPIFIFSIVYICYKKEMIKRYLFDI